jgi:hypothetical protein
VCCFDSPIRGGEAKAGESLLPKTLACNAVSEVRARGGGRRPVRLGAPLKAFGPEKMKRQDVVTTPCRFCYSHSIVSVDRESGDSGQGLVDEPLRA